MLKQAQELVELTEKLERYKGYTKNSEKLSDVEWSNRLTVQKTKDEINKKCNEILLLNK